VARKGVEHHGGVSARVSSDEDKKKKEEKERKRGRDGESDREREREKERKGVQTRDDSCGEHEFPREINEKKEQ